MDIVVFFIQLSRLTTHKKSKNTATSHSAMGKWIISGCMLGAQSGRGICMVALCWENILLKGRLFVEGILYGILAIPYEILLGSISII